MDGIIRRALGIEGVALKALGERRYRAVASTSTEDRQGDVIMQGGWVLAPFKTNPVILLNHEYTLPVARAVDIGIVNGRLEIEFEFPEPGTNQRADDAAALVAAGLLKALSVGFRPIDFEYASSGRGVVYRRQELLEVSIVSVPANAEALISIPASSGKGATPPRPAAGEGAPGGGTSSAPRLAARRAELDRLKQGARPRVTERAAELAAMKRDATVRRKVLTGAEVRK